MRILELTNYSAGVCGVWARVKEEAVRFAKDGHEVLVLSSDRIKGAKGQAPSLDRVGTVTIKRISARKLGGESFLYWSAKREGLAFKPDVIIAHSYRHLHTTQALTMARKLNCKAILVGHAPFIQRNTTRSYTASLAVAIYDRTIGKATIRKFDRIVTITPWETDYFLNLGAKKEQLVCIPNGIPGEFFSQKPGKEQSKILFFGRISPIKDLETLIRAFANLPEKKTDLEIAGPAEEKYLVTLKDLIRDLKIENRVQFTPPIYNLKEKIKKLDSGKIFVLPSKREGMPQALIEAMARKKIVIASNNQGSSSIIQHGKNGYLFPVGNDTKLTELLSSALNGSHVSMRLRAQKDVRQFNWSIIMGKWEKLLKSLFN